MIEIAAGSYVRVKPPDDPTVCTILVRVEDLVVGDMVCTNSDVFPHTSSPLAGIEIVPDQPLFSVRVHTIPAKDSVRVTADHTLMTFDGTQRNVSSFALNPDGWVIESIGIRAYAGKPGGKLVCIRPAGTGTIYRLTLGEPHVMYAGELLSHD